MEYSIRGRTTGILNGKFLPDTRCWITKTWPCYKNGFLHEYGESEEKKGWGEKKQGLRSMNSRRGEQLVGTLRGDMELVWGELQAYEPSENGVLIFFSKKERGPRRKGNGWGGGGDCKNGAKWNARGRDVDHLKGAPRRGLTVKKSGLPWIGLERKHMWKGCEFKRVRKRGILKFLRKSLRKDGGP